MKSILFLSLIWVIFCNIEGIRDAFTFQKGIGHFMKENGIDIHSVLFLYRAVIFSILFIISFFLPVSPFSVLLLSLAFPFFHEGAYYLSRKLIDNPDGYPKKLYAVWFYKSKTSTSRLNFPGWVRLLFFISSIITIVYVESHQELF